MFNQRTSKKMPVAMVLHCFCIVRPGRLGVLVIPVFPEKVADGQKETISRFQQHLFNSFI